MDQTKRDIQSIGQTLENEITRENLSDKQQPEQDL
jgi:hypothetical protein